MAEEKVLPDTEELEEELEPEETLEEVETNEEATDEIEDYDTLVDKNKKLFARAKQAETDNKKLKAKLEDKPTLKEDVKKTPDIGDDALKRLGNLELSEQKRQFGFDNNLSPEATDFVYKQSGEGDPKKALEDKFVKVALDAMKSQQKADKAAISPSSKSVSVGGKTFADMSEEDRKKNFSKVVEKIRG